MSTPPNSTSRSIPADTAICGTDAVSVVCHRWVNDQDVCEDWTDGAQDYVTYAKQILNDFSDVLSAASEVPSQAKKPAMQFGFGQPQGDGQPTTGLSFGAPAGRAPAFGTGSAAAPFTGFNFGAAASGPLTGVSSFGSLPVSQAADAVADGDDDEEEEGNEAAEPSVQLESSGTEILFKEKVQLQSQIQKEDGKAAWKGRGMGTLTVRRTTGDDASSSKPFVVFTTDAGKVLVNAGVALPPNVVAKKPNCVLMMCISNIDGTEEKALNLFKMKDNEAAKAFVDKIKSCDT